MHFRLSFRALLPAGDSFEIKIVANMRGGCCKCVSPLYIFISVMFLFCHLLIFFLFIFFNSACIDDYIDGRVMTKIVLRFYSNLLTGGILVVFQRPGVHQTYGKTAAAKPTIS